MALNKNHSAKIVILSLVSFAISLIVFASGSLRGFELKAYDLFSRKLNPSYTSNDIIIIKIDQESLDRLHEQGINWPWPRQVYAPIIEYLSEADAVFMDILFLEPSFYGEEDDRILADAIKKTSNVYLALSLTNKKDGLSDSDRDFFERSAAKKKGWKSRFSYKSANMPLDIFLQAVKGTGNVTIFPDSDGVYRGLPVFFQVAGEYAIPSLVMSYFSQAGVKTDQEGKLNLMASEFPGDQMVMLRFSGHQEPFKSISAADILKAYVDAGSSGEASAAREYFKGKKVFIGMTAAGLYDLKPTPVSDVSTGVHIHATALENLEHRNYIRPLSNAFVLIFMICICTFTCYFVIRVHSFMANLSVFITTLAITIGVPALLFASTHYMHIIYPTLSLVTSFIISVAYSYATEGKERRFIKMAFSQYMDGKLVDYILKNPLLIKPGGHRRRVTVFFADIAGFTSLAEKIPAEETAGILYEVLSSFTAIIIRNGGVIDKYIGDCIMAFWGAPLDTEKDEINACYSALECLAALDDINKRFRAEGRTEIAIRIGIHSGEAIVGNLGSDRLFDYTAVGDTVNLTSRLESANKMFGTGIIISEETLRETEGLFLTRELGMVEVKGKSVPVRIVELVSEQGRVSVDKKRIIELFHRGFDLFSRKHCAEALDIFEEILQMQPDDGPSDFYRRRCEFLLLNPQLTDGLNIIKMSEK
ncbi:MAG: adenylate/guanylate cyclase domain-containing protein [Nitrospirae bacterium]|nr:adenylate/guanylate cyclase domain-containing protein [Nitrospirota bacterium]